MVTLYIAGYFSLSPLMNRFIQIEPISWEVYLIALTFDQKEFQPTTGHTTSQKKCVTRSLLKGTCTRSDN